jgi:tRNA(Ile2)-agmatinylcytidine synthase
VRLNIGIDDTDSAKGGCTTYIAALLVEKFSRMRMSFTDYPNIIRLNPNIPYKTRGNAAVALRLEIPTAEYDSVREISIETVEENSQVGEQATDPAVLFLPNTPSLSVRQLSRRALTEIVSVPEAMKILRGSSGSAVCYGSGLGLVGALAAVGNTLEDDHTYELIAYRRRQNLGKPRRVDEDSIIKMDQVTGSSTFNNYDAKNKRVLIKPHGPDPVLLGLRGETPEGVRAAFRMLRIHEPVERWVIFRTNHGTEAHFQATKRLSTLRVNHPIVLKGVVVEKPIRISGGHVFLQLSTRQGVVCCAAFEPTGRFKEVVAKLIPGDQVAVSGGVKGRLVDHRSSLTVNLEKLVIERLVDEIILQNPLCPRCDKRMKSAGRDQGFRCPRCKYSSPKAPKQLLERKRSILPGLYIPDKKAHRHLTKPFSRYGLEKRRWNGKPPVGMWHRP